VTTTPAQIHPPFCAAQSTAVSSSVWLLDCSDWADAPRSVSVALHPQQTSPKRPFHVFRSELPQPRSVATLPRLLALVPGLDVQNPGVEVFPFGTRLFPLFLQCIHSELAWACRLLPPSAFDHQRQFRACRIIDSFPTSPISFPFVSTMPNLSIENRNTDQAVQPPPLSPALWSA
jgi:hypothetical protein